MVEIRYSSWQQVKNARLFFLFFLLTPGLEEKITKLRQLMNEWWLIDVTGKTSSTTTEVWIAHGNSPGISVEVTCIKFTKGTSSLKRNNLSWRWVLNRGYFYVGSTPQQAKWREDSKQENEVGSRNRSNIIRGSSWSIRLILPYSRNRRQSLW